jgi:conjugal transfer/entry exclusion protein
MAENTTTYKAVIDTEVKGKDEVEGLGDEADKTGGKFKSLKSQIRETTVELQKLEDQGKTNSKEFQNLKNKLDDLQDAQDRVNFKSKQFGDQLASLPGPLGQLGGGLKSAQDSIATFGKSITISLGIIGLIVAAFMAMKEALSKTTEGQEAMKKVTDALSKVMAPLFALISKVGIPIFEGLANIIGKVAEGFEWAAKKLGLTTDEVKKFDTAAQEAAKNTADAQQKELDDMAKVLAHKKQLEEKAAADRKARREQQLKEQAEREAEALREEQERLDGILKEYEKRRKDREKLSLVNLKQDTLQTQIDKNLAEEAAEKAFAEKIKNLRINTIEEQNTALKTLGTPVLIQELQKQEDFYKKSKDAEKQYVELTEADKLSIISDGIGAVASLVGENTAAGKALAVAQAAIDTYAGANKALATYPPPFGAIAAGTVIVAGLLNVKKILSTQLPKMPGSKSSPSIAGSVATPSVPTLPTMTAPQITTTGGNNPTTQLAQTLSNASKPIQAYVVSQNVSTQQALDRRINRASTLSGG